MGRLRNPTVVLAVALAAAGLAGCGGRGEARSTTPPPPVSAADLAKVTLKVGDQKGNQKALLTAAGLLNDLPYHIEWSTFTSGPPELEAASAGAIDVGAVGNTPPILAAGGGAKIATVAASKGNVESDALLVPADSPLKTAADLRGKKIALARGSSAHAQVLASLAKAGLSTNDVKLTFLQPADAYSAFTQHQVDAWATWDPYTSQAQLDTGARVLADGTGSSNGLTLDVAAIAALNDAGKNTAIKDYVVRLAKARKWSDRHRAEWADAWAKDAGIPLQVALRAANRGPDVPVRLDDGVVRSEQVLADSFTEAKVLQGKLNFAEFVDRRFGADLAAVTG
jgi:sulfonate transport system substrate-binding protein